MSQGLYMKVAIIPARGGSKRIPDKNIRDFLGKPIIAYSIEAARETGLFDEIIVSTDDENVAAIAREWGATTPFMRPKPIADDFAPIIPVLKHAVEWYAADNRPLNYLCCIYATAPFVTCDALSEGHKILQNSTAGTAMSVAKFTYPIQRALEIVANGRLDMINKNHLTTRSQDLPEAYMDAAQFLWCRPEAIQGAKESLLEYGVMPVTIPTSRVQDIDTLEDWDRAEMLYRAIAERARAVKQ
jgi:N-acylneuraminate cytidylyltransferase